LQQINLYFNNSSNFWSFLAIILDWAGTTLDYGCIAPAVAYVEIFKERKVPISIEEARIPMGAHKKVHLRALTKLDSIAKRWQNVHGKLPTENDVNEMFESFVPIQNSILPKYSGTHVTD
jgi:phosphonoacetaldehyde hydrolase